MLRQLFGFGAWNLLFNVAGLFLWWTDNIDRAAAWPVRRALLRAAVHADHPRPGRGRRLSTPLAPLAAAQAREVARARAHIGAQHALAVILTLASTGLLVVAAEDLFRLWIGPDYASGWLVYACLMASFWAVYAQMPASNILLGDIRRPAAVVLAATAGAGRKDRGAGLAWPGRDRRSAGQLFSVSCR